MAEVNKKIKSCKQALKTLERAIINFNKYEKIYVGNTTFENEELALGMRDSMIQRFEYCTDLFWKVLKIYLEAQNIDLAMISPRIVIREGVKARALSEQEGNMCIEMVNNRNKTSHMYHQEVAEVIAQNIPQFYHLMVTIIERLDDNKTV